MLATPFAVKKALKTSAYRKNYRMYLYDSVEVNHYGPAIKYLYADGLTFTITESYKYRFYSGFLHGINFSITYTESGTTTTILEHEKQYTDRNTSVEVYLEACQNGGYYTYHGESGDMQLQKWMYSQPEWQHTHNNINYMWTYVVDGSYAYGQTPPLKAGIYQIFTYPAMGLNMYKVKPNGNQENISNSVNWDDDYVYGYSAYIEDGDIIKIRIPAAMASTAYTEVFGKYNMFLDNEYLVAESVSIDERLVTGSEFKFGLCEGASLEFEYFDWDGIKGKGIQAYLDVEYKKDNGDLDWHTIPMGFFIVDKCPRQASTGIRKVTAYNKLKSSYLDAKANLLLIESYDNPDLKISLSDIQDVLLSQYEIREISKEATEIGRASYGVGQIRKLSGGSVTFRAKYGIDTKLSYYEYAGAETSTTTTAYPFVVASECMSNLETNKAYHVEFTYDMESLEKSYYDFIQQYVTEAFNVDATYMNRFMTPQTSSTSNYGSFLGWHQFCGIKITYQDSSVEWYSTIAYKNGLTGVVGSFKDLSQKTILKATKIEYFFPYSIMFNSSSTLSNFSSSSNVAVELFGSSTYRYYEDSSLTITSSGSFEWLDPNGSSTDYDWTCTGWVTLNEYTGLTAADKLQFIPSQMPEFTLRQIISAAYETECQFGQLDRETNLFKGKRLHDTQIYPDDWIHPSEGFYPNGSILENKGMHPYPSEYSQLWTDDSEDLRFRNLIITYKTLDGDNNEVEAVYTKEIHADGNIDYVMSDNWLFLNRVWETRDLNPYAAAMRLKMLDIKWYPFELWCAGLPYVETGDLVEVVDHTGHTHQTYIFQRQLQGVQNLQDTYVNGEPEVF